MIENKLAEAQIPRLSHPNGFLKAFVEKAVR
jgi:hypothetical protein